MAHDVSEAVRERLDAFTSSGDPRVIRDRQAAEEIGVLRASIGWPRLGRPPSGAAMRRGLEAVLLAGTVQFIRYQELPPADRLDALLEAMELFTAVCPAGDRHGPRADAGHVRRPGRGPRPAGKRR